MSANSVKDKLHNDRITKISVFPSQSSLGSSLGISGFQPIQWLKDLCIHISKGLKFYSIDNCV